jgi:hypothetical protein
LRGLRPSWSLVVCAIESERFFGAGTQILKTFSKLRLAVFRPEFRSDQLDAGHCPEENWLFPKVQVWKSSSTIKTMKSIRTRTLASLTWIGTALGLFTGSTLALNWTEGFQEGNPGIKSISHLTFGPEGILFAADTKAAAIVAIATADTQGAPAQKIQLDGINQKLAAVLGTKPNDILIDSIAVNPISHKAYLAVSRGRGPNAIPVLVRVDSDQLQVVPLDKLKFSRAELPDAPVDGVIGEGNRQSNPRLESITDIAFFEDRVLIAGLSNEEFASTFRAIPFPFQTVAKGTSVEIYHGSHGRFETRAPIRTFVPFNVGNEPQLLAAYTCTPLVQLPLKNLMPGAKIRGKTIAELGNRNRPLNMIVYEKDGKEYLLLANSNRGVMKVNTDEIETVSSIDAPVQDGATKGLTFQTVKGWTGIEQLARLDVNNALVVRHTDSGSQVLESLALP